MKKEEGPGTIYGENYNGKSFSCGTLDNILKKNNIKVKDIFPENLKDVQKVAEHSVFRFFF